MGPFAMCRPSDLSGQTALQADAPKLYKQLTASHLTIVLCYGQTQPWKVGTSFL